MCFRAPLEVRTSSESSSDGAGSFVLIDPDNGMDYLDGDQNESMVGRQNFAVAAGEAETLPTETTVENMDVDEEGADQPFPHEKVNTL